MLSKVRSKWDVLLVHTSHVSSGVDGIIHVAAPLGGRAASAREAIDVRLYFTSRRVSAYHIQGCR